MTQTEWRVEGCHVVIPDRRAGRELVFSRGYASGAANNCLIDTLRQQLDIVASLEYVRNQLMLRHTSGPMEVKECNFLTLDYHWADVIDILFDADCSGKPKLRHGRFRIVCVDLTFC